MKTGEVVFGVGALGVGAYLIYMLTRKSPSEKALSDLIDSLLKQGYSFPDAVVIAKQQLGIT